MLHIFINLSEILQCKEVSNTSKLSLINETSFNYIIIKRKLCKKICTIFNGCGLVAQVLMIIYSTQQCQIWENLKCTFVKIAPTNYVKQGFHLCQAHTKT